MKESRIILALKSPAYNLSICRPNPDVRTAACRSKGTCRVEHSEDEVPLRSERSYSKTNAWTLNDLTDHRYAIESTGIILNGEGRIIASIKSRSKHLDLRNFL